MAERRPNILFVLSDEHDPAVMGCSGHPAVRTPHLDRLASGGALFQNAYCTSPMCVPSRLSLHSGRYAHQVNAWDNGSSPPPGYRTWAHYLSDAGYETVAAGRTHFNGPDRLNGFTRRLSDDLLRWRHEGAAPARTPTDRRGSNSHVSECGPGAHPNTEHDDAVTHDCVCFLEERAAEAASGNTRPWALYCGFIQPHFPLVAPPPYFALYPPDRVALPPTWDEPLEAQHPVIRHLRWAFRNDEGLTEDLARRATASYWALVTLTDHRIGRLMEVIDRSALRENTIVVYSSDHGEMGGHHGIWQKQCFYEPSVRVPLIIRLPEGGGRRAGLPARIAENVSLVDLLPTLLDVADVAAPAGLSGRSLLDVARSAAASPARSVFSEYHAQGMLRGGFMLKRGDFKYCHYVGHRPQLFSTREDPLEVRDLIDHPEYAGTAAELRAALLAVCDPERVDAHARADQVRRRAA
jgi:choline-sulfatase